MFFRVGLGDFYRGLFYYRKLGLGIYWVEKGLDIQVIYGN